jgi:hypothetical protein
MSKFLAVIVMSLPLFVSAASLVPCGGTGEGEGAPAISCDFCQFTVLANNVKNFLLFKLILPLGVIALIIVGILFLIAGDNPEQINKAKRTLKYTLTGMLISFAAWLLVDTVLGNLLKDDYKPWNEFPECKLF